MSSQTQNDALRLGLVGPVPPPNGGMAMQTQQLARLLESEGVSVELLATNGSLQPAFLERVRGLRALFRLIPYLLAVWKLAGRVEVIHLMANSGWSWQLHCAPVLWLSRLRNTPVIVNYRGGEAQTYFERSFSRVRPSLRLAAATVVPSGYLQSVFEHFEERTRVIPNIIDREMFHPPDQTPSYPFTLIITRNLEPIYGIDKAIRAFAKVYPLDPSIRLRVAGSGPAENSLQELTRQLGVSAAVSFEGRLDRPAIVNLYAQAHAMINPSTVDNMPNSVLESLACGVPVISTDVGGVPFVVQHQKTALLVPLGDVTAMAEAINTLKADAELRQRLIRNGLAEVNQYTWRHVGKQWLELYNSLCRAPERVVS